MKRTLFLLLVFLPMLACADAVEIDGIYYNLDTETKTAEVTSNPSKYKGDITIPESVEFDCITYSVTSIGSYAFYLCKEPISIIIPNSVTYICNNAFFMCEGLTSVTIPNSVTTIDAYAFDACKNLASISVPNSVTDIGLGAFQNCSGLKSIVVEKGNAVYDSREDCNALIKTSENELITGCMNTTIPNSVTTIGNRAFSECTSLTSITIPNSVSKIDTCAFENCTSLCSVTIPNGVTEIKKGTFAFCSGLTSVSIPDNVTTIGVRAFYECSNLPSIIIPNSVKTIEQQAFIYCKGLTSLTIPNSVTSIGECAFYGCSGLTSILIPSSVSHIGNFAFYDCSCLASVSLPNSLTYISEGCFWGCSGLTSVTIPNSVTIIKSNAFNDCSGLTSITIHRNVTEIGGYAFNGCSSATSVTIGSKVKSIGHWAFAGCKELLDVYCYVENVPEVQKTTFNNTKTENITLHVPATSVSAYKAAEPWRNFKKIVALTAQENDTEKSDYIPFVELGKQWHVVRSDRNSGRPVVNFENYMLGEEVVKDGKTYLKLYRSEDDKTVVYDTGLLREEDCKVYYRSPNEQEEILMFDYSLQAGDTFEAGWDNVTYKVLSVGDYLEGPEVVSYEYDEKADSMVTHRRYLRKWTIGRTDNELFEKTWIEGVGSLVGPIDFLDDVVLPDLCQDNLAYVVERDGFLYLPFTFYDTLNMQIHGCDLPTGEEVESEEDHHLTYELEGDRLHVYGSVPTQCGPNNYAYFIEKRTDDPMVRKIEFEIREVEPTMDCWAFHTTNFYVPGFDPKMNYIIVDYAGEHPVINKTPQNEYRPFIEDGKLWVVSACSDADPYMEPWKEYYYFDGDTIIGGQTCKQMKKIKNANEENWVNGEFTPAKNRQEYIGAWYEQDRKVYFARTGKDHPELYYDFTLCSNDTIYPFEDPLYPLVVEKKSGGFSGFKGTYYEFWFDNQLIDRWLEGVGNIYYPEWNITWTLAGICGGLLYCCVGDEVIYYNSKAVDPYDMEAPKHRFDFTHTTKTQPKTPRRSEEEQSLYGEYNKQLLAINLDPIDEAYLVRITDETGNVVYEKAINAGNIAALNIDISGYAAGLYTVTVENSQESFTGEFEVQTTGIRDALRLKNNEEIKNKIYNLQGQRLNTLQKGLNIVNGQKVYVK